MLEKDPLSLFESAFIERLDKETEESIAIEDPSFLDEKISFFRENIREFVYMESEWFERLGVDGIALEIDDVFGTYDVMLGMAGIKKNGPKIKAFLNEQLHGDGIKFDLMFSGQEGMWNINFTLNCLEQFSEEMTIGEAYLYTYRLLVELAAFLKENKQ